MIRRKTHSGELSDEELLRRVSEQDFGAFEALYARYYDYLYRFIYRTVRKLDVIEEIINDVMLVVWSKAPTLELTVRPSTWIMAVAYKKSLKALDAARNRSAEVPLDDVPDALMIDMTAMPEDLEISNWVEAAFDLLSPEQRAVMELVYYHGMHYSEISELVGCPENTVKTRIFHARKKLKTALPMLCGE